MRLPHLLAGLTAAAMTAGAASPKLDALYPPGGRIGTTNEVEALGKFDSWPVQVWCDHPGVSFECLEKKGTLRVTIPPDAATGACLVRLFNPEGASDLKPFVLGALPEILEPGADDNNSIAKAKLVPELPVVINGRLERDNETDFFRVDLEKGQILTVQVDAYSLGSMIDPFAQVYDPRGYEAALASDSHNLDPSLVYEAKSGGTHAIQIFAIDHKASTNVKYAGNSSAVYRMTVGLGQPEPVAIPAEVQESADTADKGQMLELPARVAGRLAKPRETDTYRFAGKKDESWLIRVEAKALHLPTDPVMAVYRPGDKLLKEEDDERSSPDPEYTAKLPEDGEYTVRVWDRFQRGGEELRYRLVIEHPTPEVTIKADKDAYVLEAGKTTELKLTLDRDHGHAAELAAAIEGLPEGVALEALKIGGKEKSATLKLTATGEAAAASVPFRIQLTEGEGEGARTRFAIRSFQNDDSRGDYLVNQTEWLWLTVKAAPAPKEEEPKAASEAK